MKKIIPIALYVLLVAVVVNNDITSASVDETRATPTEVVWQVRSAARLLQRDGLAALDVLRNRDSSYVWKDTYVFVVNCEADLVLANPVFPEREAGDIKQHIDYDGKQYGQELCTTASAPNGGWIEYVWPRRGDDRPQRKISFVTKVPGRPIQVGAGIYSETYTLKELTTLIQR